MRQVVLIRHGEKSKHDPVHLNRRGTLRSMFLPDYILFPYDDFRRPSYAFIMFLNGPRKSDRCFETLAPTIEEAHMQHEFVHRSLTGEVVAKILGSNEGATSLVCWEHTRIVDIVNLLIGRPDIGAWGLDPSSHGDDGSCFDATWVCDIDDTTVRLRVYQQFDIDMETEQPFYEHERHTIFFDKSFNRKKRRSACSIM